MGISGLLPLLKSIHKHCTLKKFAGQTIGIDGYGWLHRGAVACAIELALDKPTTKYVDFAMSRVRMLLDFGVTPYVVFDGDALPSKAGTNAERRKKREEAKSLGLQLHRAGNISQAYQELQKAAGVTPQMARELIDELKKMNVQYIVAPYEADAQLAYLERTGIINGILSEDSDLLVFGARRLITKLNQYGECIEIERADFPLCKEISLAGWTDAMFRRMAILSGCDYLPNIDKMGLKTAYRFVRKYKEAEKSIRMIAFEGKFFVPQDYYSKFQHAELTFLHHRVFCPIKQKMVFLNELDRDMSAEDMPYLGTYVEADIAIGVACGDLNPKTKLPLETRTPASARPGLRENRRQTFGTPSDLKSKKSIDSFFKPQRTPLAELDPNSLTPSPSQQRLLERNRNASWDSRPVSSAPQLRRTTTSLAPVSAPLSVSRSSFLAKASTISNYQSPKRRRLCSEVDYPSEEIERSRFFAPDAPGMSPLDRKKAKARKEKREFDVWSDDSVDDILLGLTDTQQVASPTHDNQQAAHAPDEEAEESSTDVEAVPQSSPVRAVGNSQTSEATGSGTNTQASSVDYGITSQDVRVMCSPDGELEIFEDLLEYHVRKQNEKLAKTFSSQSKSRQLSALQNLPSSKPATSTIAEKAIAQQTPEPTTDRQTSPIPAARILRTFAYQSPEKQSSALQSLETQTAEQKIGVARAALAQERRDRIPSGRPTFYTPRAPSQSRAASTARITTASVLGGSEDAIIPNSEDESSEGEGSASQPTLNLQGFVFHS